MSIVSAKLDRISASSISTSTIVKDSHNVTIAEKVEVHNVHRAYHDNFKGNQASLQNCFIT